MTSHFRLSLLCLALAGPMAVAQQADTAALLAERTKTQPERLAWWDEARFGLMIYYGVHSVPAGVCWNQRVPGEAEDVMATARIPREDYRAFASRLTASDYDPENWLSLAAQAGMKYAILTVKANDGFALFDSKATDWDAVDAGAGKRDLLKPFLAACRKSGLRAGISYSHAIDWMHAGGATPAGVPRWDPAQNGDFEAYLHAIALPQVESLLADYGPIDLLSWGRPEGMDRAKAEPFLALLARQPNIVMDQRLGGGLPGDIEVVESDRLPGGPPARREWRIPLNGSWGYKSWQHEWKPSALLVRRLVEAASQGANLVLGVGPDARGRLPREAVERLKDFARWMAVNAESIHGTTPSPLPPLPWGRCTLKTSPKGDAFYLHVFTWPSDRRLVVPGLEAEVIEARLLADRGTPLKVTPLPRGLALRLPDFPVDDAVTTIALKVKPGWKTSPSYCAAVGEGCIVMPAEAAELSGVGPVLAEGDQPVLAFWDNPSVSAAWSFLVEEAGDYRITVRFAAPHGSRFLLDLEGSPAISMDSPATGDWGRALPLDGGILHFDQPGFHRIRLVPAQEGWRPLNVRSVELRKESTPK